MDTTDAIVVGAGVVGLAVARALSARGLETLVIERHPRAGSETSSRNSGVIHSGIYYPPGSLKARLCVRGRDLLYGYCQERGIAHQRCGKLIVAGEAQVDALRALHARGIQNGVSDLQLLTAAEANRLEPQVRCAAALLSPSTGIVDVHEYLVALIADVEASGGMIAYRSTVERIEVAGEDLLVRVSSDVDTTELLC